MKGIKKKFGKNLHELAELNTGYSHPNFERAHIYKCPQKVANILLRTASGPCGQDNTDYTLFMLVKIQTSKRTSDIHIMVVPAYTVCFVSAHDSVHTHVNLLSTLPSYNSTSKHFQC